MSRSLRATINVSALIACALLLSACQPAFVKPSPPPAVVHVVVTRYVRIPVDLTKPFLIPQRASNRVLDVVDAYNLRGEALLSCNARLNTISLLSGEAVPADAASAAKPP